MRILEIMDSVLAVIRNMLGDFGDEVERIKHLEISADSAFEVFLSWFGKAPAFGMLGLVDDMVGLCQLHDSIQAERTSRYVLR